MDQILTARSLAYWFMDDGSKTTRGSGYFLHTYAFTTEEHELLVKILSIKFGLVVSFVSNADGRRLHIKSESSSLFRSLVSPFIVPCMSYKLHKKK